MNTTSSVISQFIPQAGVDRAVWIIAIIFFAFLSIGVVFAIKKINKEAEEINGRNKSRKKKRRFCWMVH